MVKYKDATDCIYISIHTENTIIIIKRKEVIEDQVSHTVLKAGWGLRYGSDWSKKKRGVKKQGKYKKHIQTYTCILEINST